MINLKYSPYKKNGMCSVMLRLKIGVEVDIKKSTGLKIQDASTWDFSTKLPKRNTATNKALYNRLNDLTERIEAEVLAVNTSESLGLVDMDGKWLKPILDNFNNKDKIKVVPKKEKLIPTLSQYAVTYANSLHNKTYLRKGILHNYTQKTIDKYLNFAKHIEKFCEIEKKDFQIKDVGLDFCEDFLSYLTDKELAINTKGRYIKRLKTILKNAQDDGIEVSKDYHKIKGFEAETLVVSLTFEELEQIIETPMPTERLEKAKAWFIIACYSAQRVSDLYRITNKNIKTIQGGRFFGVRQFKTKEYIEIPIHHHIETVLKKYKGLPSNFSENEQSNRSILSELIKEVCRISRITEQTTGRYNGVKGTYPKHKLMSNHSGRRTFATNFFDLGWPEQVIMKITGHVNVTNFYKYIDKSSRVLSEVGRKLFDELEVEYKSNLEKQKEETSSMKVV